MSRPALSESTRRALGAAESGALAIEADFPGWEVSLSTLGHWYVTRREPLPGPWPPYRPTLGADGPAGLREALAAFGAP